MQLDDRLATVLRFDGSGEHAKRTQYRQLLDLLGRRKQVASRQLLAKAYNRLADLVKSIPRAEQVKIIRDPGLHLRNPLLIAALAETEPQISGAALERAELSPGDWESIVTHIPVRVHGMIRMRDDLPPEVIAKLDRLGIHERGLPQPEGSTAIGDAAFEVAASETVIDMASGAPMVAANDVAGGTHTEDKKAKKTKAKRSKKTPGKQAEQSDASDPSASAILGGSAGAVGVGLGIGAMAGGEAEFDAEVEAAEGASTGFDDQTADTPTSAGASAASDDHDISALVRRIETYQGNRSTQHSPDAPPLPLDERFKAQPIPPINGFSFSCDASGQVDWAEPDVMPMVYGMRLFDNSSRAIRRNVSRQRPIRAELLSLEGAQAIAGDWVLDAAPRFTQPGGRFFGYAGRLRRPAPEEKQALAADMVANDESDRVRQLLHELRTPVNAIQGFAEVIQQQLFGPASHEYRALAANIASDAARMLAGFDEMDRLAKLETGTEQLDSGVTDLAEIMRTMLAQLEDVLAARSASIDAKITDQPAPVGLEESAAQSLMWRLLATIAGAMGAGEECKLSLKTDDDSAVIKLKLPQSLAAHDDIFAVGGSQPTGALSAGVFGAGFALRLARAEIQALGGECARKKNWLVVQAPLLTDSDRVNNNEDHLHNVG